uniref:Protein krueppel n=1 Tax=Caenorhabditis tropicalis TaxID=1561998 RepID=A0A1I7USR1_9PELO
MQQQQQQQQHQQQQAAAAAHHHQNNPHTQLLNRIISHSIMNPAENGAGGFEGMFLNTGHQKNGGLGSQDGGGGGGQTNGGGARGSNGTSTTTKKKKGQGPGRRPALDANGMPKERPFMCPRPECRKSFCRNDHLQRHMRIHTGQRLFQCMTCLRSFSRSDHLAKHERTHSSDKPYSCGVCSRRFHKHDEQKKHSEKCQHKADEQQQQQQQTSRQQLNLMGHNMYQNQNSTSASNTSNSTSNSSNTNRPSFNSSHHFHRLVDDIERFNAIAELEQLDDDSIDDDGSI